MRASLKMENVDMWGQWQREKNLKKIPEDTSAKTLEMPNYQKNFYDRSSSPTQY